MTERTNRRRRTASMRVVLTAFVVASGVGFVGAAPALADNDNPSPTSRPDHDRVRLQDQDHWFRNRDDVRYVWFRVCEGTATGTAATATTPTDTTTTTTPPAGTTTDTVAPDALAAALAGGTADVTAGTDTTTTGTTTTDPTVTGTTTTTDPATTDPITTGATTAGATNGSTAKKYPTFIAVPLPRDEAKNIRNKDERPCYDLTTGAPAVTDTTTSDTTTTTTGTTTDPTTTTTATTETPAPVGTTG
jgi:hypothetical protein